MNNVTKNCYWYNVGPRGQIMIAKELREQLNIKPGDRIMEVIVGDHVELHVVRHAKNTFQFMVR